MKLARRDFLKRSALGIGGMLVGARLGAMEPGASEKAAPKFFDPFERVPLGKSGLKVSRVCMGTGTSGIRQESNQTRLGRENLHRLLRDAYENGIRTFDLADQYGSHPYLGPAMQGVPRDNY